MILSHRGYWLNEEEKNSIVSFERSFSLGYGTETDVRDFQGELVISHDIPTEKNITLDKFFQIYKSFDATLPLALNIKADGLQDKIKTLLSKYKIENYFVFDMSVPDTLGYHRKDINFYTRHSEYEVVPALYDESKGVWIDEFIDHWITKDLINKHLNNNKSICIVSPELHKRSYIKEWEFYRDNFEIVNNRNISICTDKPEEAKLFFK